MKPTFKVGDKVKFLAATAEGRSYCKPIWNFSTKTFGLQDDDTRVWCYGKIIDINLSLISVEYGDRNDTWDWPNEAHPEYDKHQWEREGYLQHADATTAMKSSKVICTCEITKLFNFGCQCGAFHKEQELKYGK